MSIEQQLAENTAALRSLEAAIRAIVMVNPPAHETRFGKVEAPAIEEPAELTAEPVKAAKEKAKKSATPAAEPIATQQESAEPISQSAEPAAEEPAAEPVKALDYEADIKPAVMAAAKAGKREGVVALLASFGAQKASDVPADKWGELHAGLLALVA